VGAVNKVQEVSGRVQDEVQRGADKVSEYIETDQKITKKPRKKVMKVVAPPVSDDEEETVEGGKVSKTVRKKVRALVKGSGLLKY
jgi:hypothetical protein